MLRRSIVKSLLAIPALFVSIKAQDDMTSRPSAWTCPYCKTEFPARVVVVNHRAVRFFTPEGEFRSCAYEVGRSVVKNINCEKVKASKP